MLRTVLIRKESFRKYNRCINYYINHYIEFRFSDLLYFYCLNYF